VWQLLKNLYPYIKEHKARALGSVFFAFVLAGIKLSEARLVQPIFDKGLSKDATFEETIYLVFILLGLGLVNFPARFLHFYWIRYVVDRATCRVREDIFKKLMNLPMSFYSESKQGSLISSIVNDSQAFSGGFKSSIDLIREPLMAIFLFGLLVYYDYQMTLIVVVAAPLFILIFGKSGKKVRRSQGDVQEELSHMTHNIAEGIAGQKITKAFNLQNYVAGRFEKAQQKFFSAQMRTTLIEELAHPLVELVGTLAFCGVILFAHLKVSQNEMSTGEFISYITALALLMDPIRKFSQANVRLNQSRAAWDRIQQLLKTPEERQAGLDQKISFTREISVENLSFSYGNKVVLSNVNFRIKKGEKVALVGLSGSGKSTIITLLLGLYPLAKGDIKIDGVSIKDFKLSRLRELFALVSQDIFLFNDSVAENLTLGEGLSNERVHQALEVAYADKFVAELEAGLATNIGDRGMKLSGGQQQRITIARAFVRNPEVFLFDEATSALDNESEKIVQKALEGLAQNNTVLAVAHRLSSIQNFDRIYVMSEGRVVEEGTHQELLTKAGEYSKLYALTQ
jgi:subfamily B ATP-binding cassette protein MsbA